MPLTCDLQLDICIDKMLGCNSFITRQVLHLGTASAVIMDQVSKNVCISMIGKCSPPTDFKDEAAMVKIWLDFSPEIHSPCTVHPENLNNYFNFHVCLSIYINAKTSSSSCSCITKCQ